jgi:cation diffusion facilitator family transporter
METNPLIRASAAADSEKRRVAANSLAAAVLLTVLKLVVGLATNSLGILSEAAHSGLDLVAAGITLWAVQVSGQPADRGHTYGHGKFESLSALAETLLLLGTCVWIVWESVRRLFFSAEVEVHANVWAFLVVVVSIVVDISRARALGRAARKFQSQALEADALHFSSDIWSSLVVLFGLACVVAGQRWNWPWLEKTDALAALAVAILVVVVSLRLGRKSLSDLLDSVPRHLQEEVTNAAGAVAGVEDVKQVRLRRSGPSTFADVTLGVDRGATFERTHEIADEAERAIRRVLPGADVVVHLEPVAQDDEDVQQTVRVVAARHELRPHNVRLYKDADRQWLELHLEVDASLSLGQAHRQVTEFEHELHTLIPSLDRVVSHIEPVDAASAILPAQPAGEKQVRAAIEEFLRIHPAIHPHDLQIQQGREGLSVSFHCTLEASTAITAAHEMTHQFEEHLRARVRDLNHVVIHVEPALEK